MDDNTRTNIILAAIHSVPPVTEPLRNKRDEIVATEAEVWQARVAEKARAIAVMTGPRSKVGHDIDVIGWASEEGNDKAKIVSGTVLSINLESSSTRGLVQMKTKAHPQWAPNGVEEARTERTDTAEGLMMAQRIRQELMGHRVLAFIEMQTVGDGTRKVRVIRHIEDLGIDEAVQSEG